MDSEKGNRVFARGAQCAPPLVFGAQKKPGLDRVKGDQKFGLFVDFEFLTEMGSWGTD